MRCLGVCELEREAGGESDTVMIECVIHSGEQAGVWGVWVGSGGYGEEKGGSGKSV